MDHEFKPINLIKLVQIIIFFHSNILNILTVQVLVVSLYLMERLIENLKMILV